MGIFLSFIPGILTVVAFFFASFIAWRILKEDYNEEDILSFVVWLLVFALIFGRLAYIAGNFLDFHFSLPKWFLWTQYPGISLPGVFIGAIFFSWYWTKKKNWNFWIVVDGLTPAWLIFLFVTSLSSFLTDLNQLFLVKFALLVTTFFAYFFLFQNFRKIRWYKSGKPGFIGCSSIIFYGLGLAALDFYYGTEVYLNTLLAFLIVLAAAYFLYNRSEREIKEDVGGIGKFLSRAKLKFK